MIKEKKHKKNHQWTVFISAEELKDESLGPLLKGDPNSVSVCNKKRSLINNHKIWATLCVIRQTHSPFSGVFASSSLEICSLR